jgi:putative ubiquitin-RnfH superfamily antitoxin RatB of RatAB toxin-antitoxin module
MFMATVLQVEVVYASLNGSQLLIPTVAIEGETVEQVIQRSGILHCFPEIDLNQQKVGIFGKRVNLTQPIKSEDRIEIYRPLITDPKAARRLRAKK